MSENKQPVDNSEEKADPIKKPGKPHRAYTGIGGGLAGAAIGGLLGRQLGGVFGVVVGATAGALVGKGTAQRVNRSVESVVDAAKSVAETVNQSVNGVGNALKDTVEEVKPSVKGIVDAVKDTVEEIKPGVVGATKTVVQGVNQTVDHVNSVGNTFKNAVEEVKPAVVSVAQSVVDVAEVVTHAVNSVGNASKAPAEAVESSVVSANQSAAEVVDPSVNGAKNASEDTVEAVKPSVVSASQSAAKAVNPSVNGAGKIRKNTLEEVKPSILDEKDVALATLEVEEVNPWDNPDSKLSQEYPPQAQLQKPNPEHSLGDYVTNQTHQKLEYSQQSNNFKEVHITPLESDSSYQRQETTKPKQKATALEIKQQDFHLQTQIIQRLAGFILGAATISLLAVIFGFSSRQNDLEKPYPALEARLPKSSGVATITPPVETKLTGLNQKGSIITPSKLSADGWIFIGSVNKIPASRLVNTPLIQGSKSINSPVVPSVGSIVTVSVVPGVTLRNNKPQKPNFSPKEQKALGVINTNEKLKILKVELITPSNQARSTTKVWAQVDRCGSSCK